MTTTGESLPIEEPPFPWTPTTTWAMGGLFQVGYAEGSDLLLVLSSQGRGIFDCATGERLARDYEDANSDEYFNAVRLVAPGFGPLEGKEVRMAGLFGGGLTRTTLDGWFMEEEISASLKKSIFLRPPTTQDGDRPLAHPHGVTVANENACQLQACGFSETGLSFVVALSCNLIISNRLSQAS